MVGNTPEGDELEDFKRNIDIRVYAATCGYHLDRVESWRGSAVMRHQNGDKIIITRDSDDGHYVYFSVRDDRDCGSIIDFIQFRQKLNLGEVRKELRAYARQDHSSVSTLPELAKTPKDRHRVQSAYARSEQVGQHQYLEQERLIPGELISCDRFVGMVRVDSKGNLLFPHYDDLGLCGYEIKNRGLKSFAAGGTKGLWLSHSQPDDNCLVLCESAIDCLSHAIIFPNPRARCASIGGQLSTGQRGLIRTAITQMAPQAQIVAAMDSDAEGRKLARVVHSCFVLSARTDLRFWEHLPSGYKDWNDALRANDDDVLAVVDADSRVDIESFIRELGAIATHVVPRGTPDPKIPKGAASSWDEWRRLQLARIFRKGH